MIDYYFRNIWKPNTEKFNFTGWAIVEKIKSYNPKNILDIGCGYNQFKEKFDVPFTGIDPYNSNSDIEVSIEEFNTDITYDAIMCLGSINFGPEEVIRNQIEKISKLCHSGSRIYWRQNPGLDDHNRKGSDQIDFFEWSYDYNYKFAEEFKFEIIDIQKDKNRIYAEWLKK